jgi:DNA-binding NarL/FixJ family response regulator
MSDIRNSRLSEQQRKIVVLMAQGMSAKMVAATIGLSTRTVSTHADVARKKFKAANMAHLVWILRNEL